MSATEIIICYKADNLIIIHYNAVIYLLILLIYVSLE
jgi:hypothetical protein